MNGCWLDGDVGLGMIFLYCHEFFIFQDKVANQNIINPYNNLTTNRANKHSN